MEGVISLDDYELLSKRYGRKLKNVLAGAEIKRQPSHMAVIEQERAKAQAVKEQTERQKRAELQHKDYFVSSQEELQREYDKTEDTTQRQLILFAAKRNGFDLVKKDGTSDFKGVWWG